jgi:hypothetical protein
MNQWDAVAVVAAAWTTVHVTRLVLAHRRALRAQARTAAKETPDAPR